MNADQKKRASQAFAYAIRLAGGQESLSFTLDCSQARISRIARGESEITAEIAVKIEIKHAIPRYYFRPDLYPYPPRLKPIDFGARLTAYDRKESSGREKRRKIA